jgi:predicted phosphate transport protein (TIGR00153 family)
MGGGEPVAAFRLIPKEEKFYADFIALADRIVSGATLLEKMLATDPPAWEMGIEIKQVEEACDTVTHEIIQRLNRTFVTPIDREDIFQIAKSLDDVMDAIDAAATLFPLYEIAGLRRGAAELAAVIGQQTDQLHEALQALEKRIGVQECIREIHTLEHEADLIHRDAVGHLFREERDPVAIIKWKEILDLLEAATDAAEAVADVLEGIVLKHS